MLRMGVRVAMRAAVMSLLVLSSTARAHADAPVAELPSTGVSFEVNRGQSQAGVAFLVRGFDGTAAVTKLGELLLPSNAEPGAFAESMLRMRLVGAAAPLSVVPWGELAGKANYFGRGFGVGGLTDVKRYRGVTYTQVYPGIDVAYYGSGRELEYDFIVHPGARPATIALSFEGSVGLSLDPSGALRVAHAGGSWVHRAPIAYQEAAGKRTPVRSAYRIEGNLVRVDVGAYDVTRPLFIDPVTLKYSSYAGGTKGDSARRVAVDTSGMLYAVGDTWSVDFPVSSGAFRTTAGGGTPPRNWDCFVLKIDPTKTGPESLVYASYIASEKADGCYGLATDAQGQAWVAGVAEGPTFPVTVGSSTVGGQDDGFVLGLNAAGNALVFSRLIAGSYSDPAYDVALGPGGKLYVTGLSVGMTFSAPTVIGPHGSVVPPNTGNEAYLLVLDPATNAITYGTYLGGWLAGTSSVVVDQAGLAYVTLTDRDGHMTTTASAFQAALPAGTSSPEDEIYVAKLDPSVAGAASLKYGSYFGAGALGDIALGNGNKLYIAGTTSVTNFPTTAGVYKKTCPVQSWGKCMPHAFLMKVDTALTGTASLVYSTLLGSGGTTPETSGSTEGRGVALQGDHAYVTGTTRAPDFPLKSQLPGARVPAGDYQAFVTRFNSKAKAIEFSTTLGGTKSDYGQSVAYRASKIYVAGSTDSNDFPLQGGFDVTLSGAYSTDAFASVLEFECAAATLGPVVPTDGGFDIPDLMHCWEFNPQTGLPERCPPGFGCPQCGEPFEGAQAGTPQALQVLTESYRAARALTDAAWPDASTARGPLSPLLGWLSAQRSQRNAAPNPTSELLRTLDRAAPGKNFTADLKGRTLALLRSAGASRHAAQAPTIRALNAMEIDWRAPGPETKAVPAAARSRVAFKIAEVELPRVTKAGTLALEVGASDLPRPEGYDLGWPRAVYRLRFDGTLQKGQKAKVRLSTRGISFPAGGRIRALQWDGKGYRDVTLADRDARGVLTVGLELQVDFILVVERICPPYAVWNPYETVQTGATVSP